MSAPRALPLLALAIAAHYGWNAFAVPPLTGYDAPAHAAYVVHLVEEGRLPGPYEGWASFHPPLYYLLGAGVWKVLEPLGPRAVVTGLRAIGGLALLAAGWAAFSLARRRTSDGVAALAAALLLLVPCVQTTAAMVRNEALAGGLAALAIAPLLRLQRDPRAGGAALAAGLAVGLSMATKVTGGLLLAGCVVPFLRRDLDAHGLRSAGLLLLAVALFAAPIAVRNAVLVGDPLPHNQDLEVVRIAEASQVLRERRLGDFLFLDPAALWRPSLHHVGGEPAPAAGRRNPAMANVWGLAYASTWYDAHGHRIPKVFHRDGVLAGRLLVLLGLFPSGAMLLGFGLAAREALRTRGRSEDAPLVAMAVAGLAAFVSFTAVSPTVGAAKTVYLIPLAVPAALFFVRGVQPLPAAARRLVLVGSTAAALASAAVFTESLWFPSIDAERFTGPWRLVARALPDPAIDTAIDRLVLRR